MLSHAEGKLNSDSILFKFSPRPLVAFMQQSLCIQFVLSIRFNFIVQHKNHTMIMLIMMNKKCKHSTFTRQCRLISSAPFSRQLSCAMEILKHFWHWAITACEWEIEKSKRWFKKLLKHLNFRIFLPLTSNELNMYNYPLEAINLNEQII